MDEEHMQVIFPPERVATAKRILYFIHWQLRMSREECKYQDLVAELKRGCAVY